MKAVYKGKVVAEADKKDLIYIEGNWYFPKSSVKKGVLKKSDTPYTCPWKGTCQYYDVCVGDDCAKDAAFQYPVPKEGSIEIVKKDFSNHIAFWQEVEVKE
ncbi:MAG: DUF427 domain-containing protein [bacterium]|nr:DUF427 domain-containing protein [bacterium]